MTAKYRELISGYALPVSIIVISIIGSFILTKVSIKPLEFDASFSFKLAKLDSLSLDAFFVAFGLGIALSILFFMDQNITTQIIHQPTNNLKKSPAYHLDLFVLAIVNGFLSLYGLPWMHSILPQSPM